MFSKTERGIIQPETANLMLLEIILTIWTLFHVLAIKMEPKCWEIILDKQVLRIDLDKYRGTGKVIYGPR